MVGVAWTCAEETLAFANGRKEFVGFDGSRYFVFVLCLFSPVSYFG